VTTLHLLQNVKKEAKVPGGMQCQTFPFLLLLVASADAIHRFLQIDGKDHKTELFVEQVISISHIE
jgi:hypothetical protein